MDTLRGRSTGRQDALQHLRRGPAAAGAFRYVDLSLKSTLRFPVEQGAYTPEEVLAEARRRASSFRDEQGRLPFQEELKAIGLWGLYSAFKPEVSEPGRKYGRRYVAFMQHIGFKREEIIARKPRKQNQSTLDGLAARSSKAIRLINEGYSLGEVASAIGRSYETVRRYLKSAGEKQASERQSNEVTPENFAVYTAEMEKGTDRDRAARKAGVHHYAMRRHVKALEGKS